MVPWDTLAITWRWPAAHCVFPQSTILRALLSTLLQVIAKRVHTYMHSLRALVRSYTCHVVVNIREHVCACGGGSYIRTCACFVFVCSVCACLKVYNHTYTTGAYVHMRV